MASLRAIDVEVISWSAVELSLLEILTIASRSVERVLEFYSLASLVLCSFRREIIFSQSYIDVLAQLR